MASLQVVHKTFRHTQRYLEMLRVLSRYGFYDLISQSGFDLLGPLGKKISLKRPEDSVLKLSRWERVRLALEEMGTTYVKFGQILSTRGDLIPDDLVEELKKLQDKVPPFPHEEAMALIEKEFGRPVEELFSEFSATPIASASIAQVYRATTLEGEKVALKLQRPGIRRTIDTDLEIMTQMAVALAKHVSDLSNSNLVNIVREFDMSIHRELSFSAEASNLERFGNNMRKDPTIYVPACYRKLSTGKVLVMEYIEGIKITENDRFRELDLDPKLIAQRGVDLELKQIFEYGFFHADPHPGNLLVLPGNVICFLDFGMMGTLTRSTRELVISMAMGGINRDYEKISRNILKICETTGEVHMRQLESQVTELVDLYFYQSLENIDMTELFASLVKFFPQNNLVIPADLFAFGRALLLLQGDGQIIDPDFNIASQVTPYFEKLVRKRFHPEQYIKEMAVSSEEILRLAKDMPFEIRELMEKAREGKLKVNMEHQGLDVMGRKHEQISNRITMAIILASITLGSSILVLAEVPPLWHEIPVIGLVGFLGATVLGFWLLISIMRSGRM